MNDNTNFTSSYWIDQTLKAVADAEGWRLEQKVVRTGYDSSTIYDYYQTRVLSAGTNGPRGITWGATGSPRSRFIVDHIARTSDDVEFIVGFNPATLTPTADASICAVQGQYRLIQRANGLLRFMWITSAGGSSPYADFDPATLGVSVGNISWLRFRMDVDNGNGGFTITANKAASWWNTATGVVPPITNWGSDIAPIASSPVATAGVTDVTKASVLMEVGGRGSSFAGGGAVDPWQGTLYGFYPKNGFDGGLLVSANIDDWGNAVSGINSNFVGSPTLTVFNGGSPGKDAVWMAGGGAVGVADTERPNRLIVPGSTIVTLNDGHNEANKRGSLLRSALDSLHDLIVTRCPMAVRHVLMQNPEALDHSGFLTAGQRAYEMGAYLSGKGWQLTDGNSVFYTTPLALSSTTQTANVHPTSLGYQLIAQAYAADFGIPALPVAGT
jgi:hypothetical protein